MKDKSWRDIAIARIANHLIEYEAQCLCLGVPKNAKDARKHCNDHYPFSQRQYTPYKTWLEELKLIKPFIESGQFAINYSAWRGQITSKGRKKNSQLVLSPGQLTLIP